MPNRPRRAFRSTSLRLRRSAPHVATSRTVVSWHCTSVSSFPSREETHPGFVPPFLSLQRRNSPWFRSTLPFPPEKKLTLVSFHPSLQVVGLEGEVGSTVGSIGRGMVLKGPIRSNRTSNRLDPWDGRRNSGSMEIHSSTQPTSVAPKQKRAFAHPSKTQHVVHVCVHYASECRKDPRTTRKCGLQGKKRRCVEGVRKKTNGAETTTPETILFEKKREKQTVFDRTRCSASLVRHTKARDSDPKNRSQEFETQFRCGKQTS